MTVLRTVFWRRLDVPGAEIARLLEAPDAWATEGTVLVASPAGPARLHYRVECDRAWATRAATISGFVGDRSAALDIRADGRGAWTLDDGAVPAVAGCLDVDLGFTPSTNLLPVRRLSLGVGQSAAVRAAWLRFPDFTFEPLEQTYTRTGERAYRYESGGGRFTADLTVDALGLVSRYGDYWHAVPG